MLAWLKVYWHVEQATESRSLAVQKRSDSRPVLDPERQQRALTKGEIITFQGASHMLVLACVVSCGVWEKLGFGRGQERTALHGPSALRVLVAAQLRHTTTTTPFRDRLKHYLLS